MPFIDTDIGSVHVEEWMLDPAYLERDAESCAKARGLNLVKDRDDLLLLDLDTPRQRRMAEIFLLGRDPSQHLFTTSQNGKWHCYIKLSLPLLPSLHRIELQAKIGSDPVRARLDATRIELKLPVDSNVLFETDAEFARVQEWLRSFE